MRKLHSHKLSASAIGSAGSYEAAPQAPATATTRKSRTAASRGVLLALLALDAVATLGAIEATGALHSHLLELLTVLIACATAAAVLAGVAIAYTARRPRSAAPVAAAAPRAGGFSTSKAILMLLMVVGIVAYFGGAGTFAGFTAETSNPNDTLASGTLTLRNNVTSNCDSSAGESSNNVNANCNVALAFTNQEPGVYVGTATVTLTNTGSLDASKLYLWAPYTNAVLSTATGVAPISSLTVYSTAGHGPVGVEGAMSAGDLITVTFGSHTQIFCVASNVAPGAASVPVETFTAPSTCSAGNPTPTFNFPAGSTIQDTSTDTTASNTNCYDTQQTVLGSGGGWNPATGNPLCVATLVYVQETTGGKNYCWFGNTSGAPSGACTAPISTTASAGLSGAVTPGSTLTVAALTGNVKGGDTLQFSENGNVVQCPADASDHYVGATSITLGAGACTVISGANSGFNSSAVITDYTTTNTLSSDSAHTISQFDITKNYAHQVELTPVTANGATGPAAIELAKSGGQRTFVVGVFIPGPAAAQNQLQGLKSTFGLTWHIDQ